MLKEFFVTLAKRIYEDNTEKGFWDVDQQNRDQKIMLMVEELGELLTAHRRGKTALIFASTKTDLYSFMENYDRYVKGSVEEEIADFFIRLCDYMHAYAIPFRKYEYGKASKNNFAADVLHLNRLLLLAFDNPNNENEFSYVVSAVEKFCEWYDIDLLNHVNLKLKYNKNRPHKHGKAY